MNVGDRVIVKADPYPAPRNPHERCGMVTRVFRTWVRVALDDTAIPQDFPASACRLDTRNQRAQSHQDALEGYCWCGDPLDRHAAPCRGGFPSEAVA